MNSIICLCSFTKGTLLFLCRTFFFCGAAEMLVMRCHGCWQKMLAFRGRHSLDIQLNGFEGLSFLLVRQAFPTYVSREIPSIRELCRLSSPRHVSSKWCRVLILRFIEVSWMSSWISQVVVWTWQCHLCWDTYHGFVQLVRTVVLVLFHKTPFSCLTSVFKKVSKYSSEMGQI